MNGKFYLHVAAKFIILVCSENGTVLQIKNKHTSSGSSLINVLVEL